MQRDIAIALRDQLLKFERWFSDVTELTTNMDAEEGRRVRKVLADMFLLEDNLRDELRKQHPDLFDE